MEVKKRMEERKMATVPSNQQWKKENTVMVGVRLMKKTDMDIINALQTEGTKQERLRDLLRKGIAYEQQVGGVHGVSAPDPAPAAPAPDKETQRLARVGAEYEDMLRRGWVMVEPEKKEETTGKSVQDALSRLQRVMEERRAREAQQEEQEQKEE
jgi:inosine-uridine nucleoside N-ribohydrolase